MRFGRLPAFNNNNNNINTSTTSYLPGTTSIFYLRMLTTIWTSSWRKKKLMGNQSGWWSSWAANRQWIGGIQGVHPPLAILRCRIPGVRVFFPLPVQPTYPALTGELLSLQPLSPPTWFFCWLSCLLRTEFLSHCQVSFLDFFLWFSSHVLPFFP